MMVLSIPLGRCAALDVVPFPTGSSNWPMDHTGVAYTIRQGIERDDCTVVVQLPDGTVEKRTHGGRAVATASAIAIIDKWLEKNRRGSASN